MALDKESKSFMVYIAAPEALFLEMTIYPLQIPYIDSKSAQVTTLKQNEASIKVPAKYSEVSDVFLAEKVLVLLKQTKLNKYAIELKNSKHPPYDPIYNISLVELELLKTYIKIHLKIKFIWLFKFFAGALI